MIKEEEFDNWLKAGGAQKPSGRKNRISTIRLVERKLDELGIDFADLESAWRKDRFRSLLERLSQMRQDAQIGGQDYRILMPNSEKPISRLENMRNYVARYGRFLDGEPPRSPSDAPDQRTPEQPTPSTSPSDGGRLGEPDPESPMNLILYGPPGTGKTFSTTKRCVEICDGKVQDDKTQKNIRARYTQLIDQGRVEFVTFHQSYGYEEFVEGLRPTTDKSDSNGREVGFRLTVRDGVMKRLAARARRLSASAEQPQETLNRRFFKMGLGDPQVEPEIFDRCVAEKCIRLNWCSEVDWSNSKFSTLKAIVEHWQQTIDPGFTAQSKPLQFVHLLRNVMQLGDIIVVPNGIDRFRAIGEVTGGYTFDEEANGYFANRREVQWHWIAMDEGKKVSIFQNQNLAPQTIHRLSPEQPDRLLSFLNTDDNGPFPPHVLIIDEINRANISKVMGELITLLEEDKREGERNQVAVTLPYSGETFTLPANLHILGTMNTADRSIALIDTALRRRFQFEEMAPRPNLLHVLRDTKKGTEIDLPEVLRAMNRRLEYLIDRDHLIGHAWLMGAKTKADVDAVMRRKIIPLIAEYFYDDWAKVKAVLGGTSDFVQSEQLDPPPGLPDEIGEKRERWIVREEFGKNAYACLIAGKRVEDEAANDESS